MTSLMRLGLAVVSSLAVLGLVLVGEGFCTTIMLEPGESIQVALDEAPEGATIVLAEGEWLENVTIRSSVALRGAGVDVTHIKGRVLGVAVVDVSGDEDVEVTITGLSVRESIFGEMETYREIGIVARGHVQLSIVDVAIAGHWHGVSVRDQARAHITDCVISDNRYSGLVISGSAQVVAARVDVPENLFGIYVQNDAMLELSESCVNGNSSQGIYLWGMAQAIISDCAIIDNGGDGLQLRDSSQATLRRNAILRNLARGVTLMSIPCYSTDPAASDRVRGYANVIPAANEDDGNAGGALCPVSLEFLMSEEVAEPNRLE